MISLASELLSKFIEEEAKKVAGEKMPHMPTLGEAYEEITKDGIDRKFSIPHSLDLRVVKGFIEIEGVLLKEQIDCMLVVGDGRQYGRTSQFFYDIDQVLCIFEVKKTLNKDDLSDAFNHLGGLRRKYMEYFDRKVANGFVPEIGHARVTFAQITGSIAPETYADIRNMPDKDGLLFYTLVIEENAPISIIHGYGGYRTEPGLRNAFADFIESSAKLSGAGLGVTSVPNLITSNQFCLIKANGMPYAAITGKNELVAVASTRYNSARIILEIIWAKISSYFGVKMPYGEDLEMENLSPLLIASPVVQGNEGGWMYSFNDAKEKELKRVESLDWQPEKIDSAAMSIVNIMFGRGGYLGIDEGLEKYIFDTYNVSLSDVLTQLKATKLFAVVNSSLRPVFPQTMILTNDDETGYVAADRNRLDGWCKKNEIPGHYMTMIFIDEV